MLTSVKRCLAILSLVSLLMAVSMPALSSPVLAQSPVSLELHGEGATSWNIGNIKPGDTGTKFLTLRNAAPRAGFISIWLSDVVNSEGTNPESETGDKSEPGELGDFLLLTLYNNRLSTNVNLPATVNSFPQSSAAPTYINISPIAPGETIDLTWQWQLPAGTDNRVQGDIVSFSINYKLEEMPVEGGGTGEGGAVPVPITLTLTVATPEQQVKAGIQNGALTEPLTVVAASNHLTLGFERGTRIIADDNNVPERLEVTVSAVAAAPPPPQGMAIVSDVYQLLFRTTTGARPVTFSQPVSLILRYDPDKLPRNIAGLFVAYYDDQAGWTELEPLSVLLTGEGEVAALVNHFTLFAVLARLSPVAKPLPADFNLRDLRVTPGKVNVGENVTIRVQIANDGGLSGERSLTLKINGLFVEAKLVNLAPGQNRNVSFTVTPRKPGVYEVEVGGQRTSFAVSDTLASLIGEGAVSYNWLVYAGWIAFGLAIVAAAALLLKK